MTDLSDSLVNTMAATLANGGTFSDQRMTAEVAGNDCLADLVLTSESDRSVMSMFQTSVDIRSSVMNKLMHSSTRPCRHAMIASSLSGPWGPGPPKHLDLMPALSRRDI